MADKLNGMWERKNDPADYIRVERVYKKGYVAGFQYFNRDGQEVISTTPVKMTKEELLENYQRR